MMKEDEMLPVTKEDTSPTEQTTEPDIPPTSTEEPEQAEPLREEIPLEDSTSSEATAEESSTHDTADTTEEAPAPSTEKAPLPIKKAGIALTLKPIHLIIAALTAIAVVAGGIVIGMNLHRWLADPDIDPNAQKYPYPGTTNVAEGEIAIPGYSRITFPANSREAKMILPNPDNNPCYFVFSIILEDTDEVIYRSGMIPPGMAVTDLTLNRPLEAGEYPIVIRIECFSLEDKTPMNGANVNATLSAK